MNFAIMFLQDTYSTYNEKTILTQVEECGYGREEVVHFNGGIVARATSFYNYTVEVFVTGNEKRTFHFNGQNEVIRFLSNCL